MNLEESNNIGGPSDADLNQDMDGGLRRSTRKNKGVPPERFGFESTSQSVQNLEETLMQLEIEKTQAQLTIIELKEKQTRMLLEKEKSSVTSQKSTSPNDDVLKNFLPFDRAEGLKTKNDAHDGDESVVSERSDKTLYTKFLEDLRGKASRKKTVKDDLDDSRSSSGKSSCSQNSHVTDVLRDQTERMDRFLSRQTQGKDVFSFDGSFEEWPLFYSWYENSTKTCHFTDQENLLRLQRCLKGAAREAVQILLYAPGNVTKIISTLKRRFGRPDFLVKSLVAKARNIPAAKEERPETIIDMSNAVTNLVASLTMFEKHNYVDNPQLLEEFLAKLPLSMRVQWSEFSLIKGHCTLETFSDWMELRAMAAEERMSFQVQAIEKGGDLKGSVNKGSNKKSDKKVRLVAATNETNSDNGQKCSHCDGAHFIADCQKFKGLTTDDKWKFVTDKKLCFRCLRSGHISPDCRKKLKCTVNDCGRKHNSLLHKDVSPQAPPVPASTPRNSDDAVRRQDETDGTVAHATATGRVLMKILPVFVSGPNGTLKTSAFLDEGSSMTMVKTSLADKLGLRGPLKSLAWRGTTPNVNTDDESREVEMKIRGSFPKAREFTMHRVRTVKDLSLPKQTVDVEKLSTDWRYLTEADVESQFDTNPEILIGLDNTPLIVSREVIHGPYKAPYLVRTWLGWVIMGQMNTEDTRNTEMNYAMFESLDELNEMVKQSFSTEAFGTIPLQEVKRSRDDRKALEIMENTIQRTADGRYEVGLLWRDGKPPNVPDSRGAALKRLYSTERRLDREPELAGSYYTKISDHIEKGYLEKLTESDKTVPPENTWYLPHFAVINPVKKKLRVVFDCAAKSRGVSLNDKLLKGPDLLQSLPAVLMNFRRGKFGFTGDIREMFHRVKVRQEDQHYQRVLYRGTDRQSAPDEYKLTVMTFGASCSPTLAGFVKDTNAQRFVEKYPETVNEIQKYMYCDDFISCADSIEEAQKRISEVIEIHQDAGFDVVNWVASDSRILHPVTVSECEKLKSLNETNQLDRVLGLWWDPGKDIFTFTLNFHKVAHEVLSGQRIPTKREVLSLVMSIYDPLGFLGPLTVKGKMILQMVWRQNIGWDDEIESEVLSFWQKFLKELQEICSVNIPRCYSTNLNVAYSVQLHVFGDASSSAFASVAYLRIESVSGVEIAFLSSRTRVAPLKPITIPRLELQAAVLSSRVGSTVRSVLDVKIDQIFYWTDSMTVLCWLKNDSRNFKQFVAHRISEIEDLTDIASWRWVPTKDNPADLATRMLPSDCSENSRWIRGPEFLRLSQEQWPEKKMESDDFDSTECEHEFVNVHYEHKTDPLTPDATRFSSWTRLLRATAYVMKTAENWLAKVKGTRAKDGQSSAKLTVNDLQSAEKRLWREMQTKYLPEITRLREGKEIDSKSSLYKLSPFVDCEGVLRMNSRLVNSPEDVEKFPVILDPKHPATKLLILDAHERNLHQGREQIVNNLREQFWIPGIRQAVKGSWRDCQTCCNHSAQPKPPRMAPLPSVRVQGNLFPFTRTGVDFFGPIMVTKGRRQEKRWGVLFTCMATRAIHLEIAHSLSTDSAIMAIRRFISRRGPVRELFSDNGTNFHGADKEMREALMQIDNEKIRDSLSAKFIEWSFNPPSAPHMGGCWERLIRSVKTAMKATLAFHSPSDEILQTIFAEVEYIVNNRPLTHVSIDPSDPTALTPNHFLLGRSASQLTGDFDDKDLCLKKAWRKSQRLIDMFWQRWIREYLPELSRRTKWFEDVPPIEKGSVVIIADGNLPRNEWPLGVIEEVFPGPDGNIRSVAVRTTKGLYRRPVTRICVLGVRDRAKGRNVADSNSNCVLNKGQPFC